MKKRVGVSCCLIVFVFLGLMLAPAGWAAQLIFVCIPGIPGESTAQGYENCIEATSYSDGIFNSGDVLGNSGKVVAGKPTFSPIQITKSLDKASPVLRQFVALGRHLTTVTIHIVRSSTDLLIPVADIALGTALITEVYMTVNLTEAPKEAVTFEFTKISFTYFKQNSDGTNEPVALFTWDRQKNAAF